MNHDQWEEDVRARRNFILTIAGAVLLALILLVFWLNNRSNPLPLASVDEQPAAAAEGAQAQPTLPDEAPPTVADTVTLNPDLNQRTLPPPVAAVGAADNPAANPAPPPAGERIVIGGNVVDQFEAASAPPEGWYYLPEVGVSSIFRLQENGDGQGHRVMLVETRENTGVLQKDVNVALDPDTSLRWQWNVLSLPSEVAEDMADTHDFFSIAVRFDNGQDLTYMWSSTLLDGTSFRCPLPEWNQRETHLVVRSGEGGLNQWLREERNLLADYQRYVGGTVPARVTQIWLIASSEHQKSEARAVFMDISVGDERQREQVL